MGGRERSPFPSNHLRRAGGKVGRVQPVNNSLIFNVMHVDAVQRNEREQLLKGDIVPASHPILPAFLAAGNTWHLLTATSDSFWPSPSLHTCEVCRSHPLARPSVTHSDCRLTRSPILLGTEVSRLLLSSLQTHNKGSRAGHTRCISPAHSPALKPDTSSWHEPTAFHPCVVVGPAPEAHALPAVHHTFHCCLRHPPWLISEPPLTSASSS